MAAVVIADRQDIHKSCKSIETVVNILNDYCEAISAVATIQKKLARALRDCGSVKSTAETAVNALGSSANIFDSIYEVDHKFAKLVDRECEGVSTEVKKWFKKLAKEEKVHDDKIAHANAKIKQAGLQYEKKSKKNPRDAQDEHTRYIALLTSLGPEITQDKYNHSLSISKRHTTVLQLVAGSLSRVAESEWQRSCEQVRRISPNVGQLGEWRSLCEGGWIGSPPLDLPSDVVPNDNLLQGERSSDSQGYDKELTVPSRKLVRNSRGNSPTSEGWQGSSSRTSFERPRQQGLAPEFNPLPEGRNNSATSLTSLGSFPVPPAHFPLPPVQTTPHEKEDATTQRGRKTDAVTVPTEQPPLTRTARDLRISTLPIAMLPDGPSTTPLETPSPLGPTESTGNFAQQEKKDDDRNLAESQANHTTPREPFASSSGKPTKPNDQSPQTHQRIEATNAELGFKQGSDSTPNSSSHGKGIERSDTGSKSNGSIVAALRDRYTRATGQTSPPPKEVPRLPLSVSNIATRYESSTSPRQANRASVEERRRPPAVDREEPTTPSRPFPSSSTNDGGAYRHRMEDIRELELREHEHRLRLREHEIEEQALILERERVRLMTAPRNSTSERPWMNSPSTTSLTETRHLYAHSPMKLVPPASTSAQYTNKPLYASPSGSPVLPHSIPEHPPFCSCDLCTASRYGVRTLNPSPRDLRPPESSTSSRPEKPRGWIRRLSMPVMGNAFSDSKKTTVGTTVGVGYRTSMAFADEEGRIRGALGGGVRNRSTSNLGAR